MKIDPRRLKEELGRRGLSQRALAQTLGVWEKQVSKIMARGSCSSDMLDDIEAALQLPSHTLLRRDKEDRDNKPRYYRLKARMTVRELGEKAGVGVETISRLENGGDCYSFLAAALAKVLGVPMGVYLGYEEA